ncbi:hypothetical protein FHS72_002665 [Loktanella ponticola]|uniref:Uncharacterized protein n=1 Tax=Yoonia ponticola TaxID=1524255 RepID=A0A7W9BN09_9RHOB|nr:hypothetical protein [Yoonia ponticola]MBB5723029.1 hypothetical protein [Yoonia ponticola]
MTDFTLVKNRLSAGVWDGTLTGPVDASPVLVMRHNDEIVPGLAIEKLAEGRWFVQAPVPVDLINDDVQTFVIVDESTNAILNSFTVFAGDQMSDEMQVELDLLRAELDILKRAFRKHCIETA